MMDALTDLTGGVTEEYIIRGPRSNLPGNIVNILFKAIEHLALIGCSISVSLLLVVWMKFSCEVLSFMSA